MRNRLPFWQIEPADFLLYPFINLLLVTRKFKQRFSCAYLKYIERISVNIFFRKPDKPLRLKLFNRCSCCLCHFFKHYQRHFTRFFKYRKNFCLTFCSPLITYEFNGKFGFGSLFNQFHRNCGVQNRHKIAAIIICNPLEKFQVINRKQRGFIQNFADLLCPYPFRQIVRKTDTKSMDKPLPPERYGNSLSNLNFIFHFVGN